MITSLRKSLLLIFTLSLTTHTALAGEESKAACREGLARYLSSGSQGITKGCPVTKKLITWISIQRRNHGLSFDELSRFITANPQWPQQDILKQEAERAITEDTSASTLKAWFKGNPPQTGNGVLAYARILAADKKTEPLKKFVNENWPDTVFGPSERVAFLKEFGRHITASSHNSRLDRLIREEHLDHVPDMYKHVSAGQRQLAEVRIALKQGARASFAKLSQKQTQSEGLMVDYAMALKNNGKYDEARDVVLSTPHSPTYAPQWFKVRNYIAREYMEEKRFKEAYKLMANHGLKAGEDYSNAEWTAGWVALRFLKQPKKALTHFTKLDKAVKSPISVARASYWLGRTYEALNQGDKAKAAYERGSKHLTTFYGQLSAVKLERNHQPTLKATNHPKEQQKWETDQVFQAFQLLSKAGAKGRELTRTFAISLATRTETPAQREALVALVHKHAPHDVVWTAKKAGATNHVVHKVAFPMIANTPKNLNPKKALIHAIAYQESRFDTTAISPAGAMGLMQVMPATAQRTASKAKIPHHESKLIKDPAHNLRIGSVHLQEVLDQYGGSYVLTAAAYNAGSKPVDRWIALYGDPRSGKIDPIDWIELCPYYETRNYMHRVLENVTVYRSLMGDKTRTIIDDLQG